MKTKIRNLFTIVSIVLLVVIMSLKSPVVAEAKMQDGTYYFSSNVVTKFQIKDGVLVLKIDKDDTSGINKTNNANYKKYKLKVKVSKKCKYRSMEYVRGTGKSYSGKSSYKKIKNAIDGDRSFYKETGYGNNVADYCIEVKNNKVVKITYTHM